MNDVTVDSRLPWIVRLDALPRLAIAMIGGAAVWLTLGLWLSWHFSALAGWDVGAACYLGLGWLLVASTDEHMTRLRAQRYDPNGAVISLLVVGAASASFVAIGFIV